MAITKIMCKMLYCNDVLFVYICWCLSNDLSISIKHILYMVLEWILYWNFDWCISKHNSVWNFNIFNSVYYLNICVTYRCNIIIKKLCNKVEKCQKKSSRMWQMIFLKIRTVYWNCGASAYLDEELVSANPLYSPALT